MLPWVCTPSLICPIQIGAMLVKADGGHFTGTLSSNLGLILWQELFINTD